MEYKVREFEVLHFDRKNRMTEYYLNGKRLQQGENAISGDEREKENIQVQQVIRKRINPADSSLPFGITEHKAFSLRHERDVKYEIQVQALVDEEWQVFSTGYICQRFGTTKKSSQSQVLLVAGLTMPVYATFALFFPVSFKRTENKLSRNGSCGGYLEAVYGSITSPNYPSFYGDNEQCIWYIRGDSDQRIKLKFTYVDLEVSSNCRYDYIAIYDGPSTNSVLLAKFCSGSDQTFTSTSNSMTVYFKTDSSVTRQGFSASYYILPNDDELLTCSSDYMEAKISRSYLNLLGFNEHSLYLNDRNCRPIITASDVIFKIPLNRCGTEWQENNSSIIYSNTIRSSPSDSVVTRETNLQFNIGCEMQQDTMSKIMYVTKENTTGDIIDNITESGMFNVSMRFYESPSFTRPVLESPYYVDLRQNLYVQVELHSSDQYLVVFVDACTASPYSFDWTSKTYDLIKNGCVKDGTYGNYPSPAHNIARFKFSAFKFLNLHPSVYLQCKVVVCKAYDYSSRCYRGCIYRQKRAISSSKGSTDVLIGPIELKKDLKQYKAEGFEEVNEAVETNTQSSFPFVLSLIALIVAVSVLVVTVLKYRKQQRHYARERL
ncbi:deleted in malignant brain tumors 1 protein [Rhincodon typus]|uniref:deleted in malignant brain tumors 1 protein n=1 Tax=Rhincodon typus TaxID=259920 RepID=UPI00202E1457|nr:deleted in malignant brain tumors 1 protein [Rhincodon typus]